MITVTALLADSLLHQSPATVTMAAVGAVAGIGVVAWVASAISHRMSRIAARRRP